MVVPLITFKAGLCDIEVRFATCPQLSKLRC